MGMSVVLIGSPARGYRVVGPFKTFVEAQGYATAFETAWALRLEAPAMERQLRVLLRVAAQEDK